MAERLRDERDRRAIVDGVRRVGMSQPVRRSSWVAAGALYDRFQNVIDTPFSNWEHARSRRCVMRPAGRDCPAGRIHHMEVSDEESLAAVIGRVVSSL